MADKVVMSGLWREADDRDWQEVEVLGRRRSGDLECRETGRLWPGVFVAPANQVRVGWRLALPAKAAAPGGGR